MLNLVTAVTADYPHTERWLESTKVVKSAKVWCVMCIGFSDETKERSSDWVHKYPHVNFRTMPRHWSESHGMLQHGRALDAIPELGPEDVVCQVDADIIVQREFLEYESRTDLVTGNFFMGYNKSPEDSLADEAKRIGLDQKAWGNPGRFDCHNKIGNCGVMMARISDFIALRDEYERWCTRFYAQCRHRCRCQYLINWCIKRLGFFCPIFWIGAWHQHGHFGTPEGVELIDGKWCYNGEVIMFAHKLGGK